MKAISGKLGALLAFVLFMVLIVPGGVYSADVAELYVFFADLCNDCHGANPKFSTYSARGGYEHSGHKNNGNAYYANGDGCQQCHTHEGFVEYLEKGVIDPKSYIQYPSQPNCFTCHDPHKTGDLSVRKNAALSLADNTKFDMGKGNLCANCHQVRGKARETVKAMPANKVLGHWGAHHGPQTDMVVGTNAYEFEGKKYYSSVHATLIKDGCVVCHMTYPKGRYGFSPGISGHSFRVSAEIHDNTILNTTGCVSQSCHEELKQVRGKDVFDYKAKADFDNDKKIESLQEEIQGLLDFFVNKNGTGYLQKLNPPMYNANGSWNQTKSEGVRPINEMAALYNYKFVLEDRSRGIHNAPYTIQILYDTLKAIDPGFDTSKRNTYDRPENYKAKNSNK